ncbi:serine/threonine protein kinase [Streptomyces sp. M600PL45_2]|uniref:Serine/threonine protein kinase n=2 Tax=Streptomyces marispadix TaxID=2922868 RepID=A0ABS9T4Z1_9ACTN|nr:serine/threonine protein kinase [Streptomyces marispadix]
MGTVYLARSRGGRAVAVKVARAELATDAHFRARFRAEVTAARAVGGFHTAPVVDADPDANPPWLATAYIPGPTLAERIQSQGPMNAAELKGLGAALAEALAAIHACGLVHRDLKPGNIILAADGPRVLDFGIARAVEATRLTATGHAFGTPGFLAPEQATGDDATGRADVFALGAVLVAAAGGSAFGEGTPMALMYRSVHETPDLSAVPAELRDLVASCLAKAPDHRPTPAQLLDRLDALTDAATSYRLKPPRSQHPPYVPTVPETATDRGAGQAPAPSDDVFIAADKDCSIAVDADGVMLTLHRRWLPVSEIDTGEDIDRGEVATEVPWPEIDDITHHTVGKSLLHVTVTLHDGSTFEIDINARRVSRVQQWNRDLAEAVTRYLIR